MKFGIYVIRDAKTTFMTPTVDQTVESAVRNFSVAINHGTSLLNAVPQDFDLFQIGIYDVESGIIEAFTAPKFIVSGASVVRKDDINESSDEA